MRNISISTNESEGFLTNDQLDVGSILFLYRLGIFLTILLFSDSKICRYRLFGIGCRENRTELELSSLTSSGDTLYNKRSILRLKNMIDELKYSSRNKKYIFRMYYQLLLFIV